MCECKEALTAVSVPPEVYLQEGGDAWLLVATDKAPAADEDFYSKLKSLQAEGKTVEGIRALLAGAQTSASSADLVLHAFDDLLQKTNKPPSEGGYCHLRIFSGTHVPAGDEHLNHWLELMVEGVNLQTKRKNTG